MSIRKILYFSVIFIVSLLFTSSITISTFSDESQITINSGKDTVYIYGDAIVLNNGETINIIPNNSANTIDVQVGKDLYKNSTELTINKIAGYKNNIVLSNNSFFISRPLSEEVVTNIKEKIPFSTFEELRRMIGSEITGIYKVEDNDKFLNEAGEIIKQSKVSSDILVISENEANKAAESLLNKDTEKDSLSTTPNNKKPTAVPTRRRKYVEVHFLSIDPDPRYFYIIDPVTGEKIWLYHTC